MSVSPSQAKSFAARVTRLLQDPPTRSVLTALPGLPSSYSVSNLGDVLTLTYTGSVRGEFTKNVQTGTITVVGRANAAVITITAAGDGSPSGAINTPGATDGDTFAAITAAVVLAALNNVLFNTAPLPVD